MNLVNELAYDGRLNEWIDAQAAKIVLRYYNRESLYFTKPAGLHIDSRAHIAALSKVGRSKSGSAQLMKNFETACSHFMRGGHQSTQLPDPPLSDSVINPEVAREVVAGARKEGFRFVVVLDGLDLLEITRAYRRRFELLSNQAIELTTSNKRVGFATVLVMRTTTVFNVIKTEFFDAFQSTDIEFFHLSSPRLIDVLDARLTHIATEVRQLVAEGFESWEVRGLNDHLDRFRKFLFELESEEGYSKEARPSFIDALENIQGSNVRAKVHMLQYKYYEFLTRERPGGIGYQAVETLMKAGRRFPPVPYRYSAAKEGVERSLWHKQKYDSRFIPSLFRYPFVSVGLGRALQRVRISDRRWTAELDYVLLGARLAQVLDLQQRYLTRVHRLKGREVSSEMVVGDIIEFLNAAFGYDKSCLLAALEEFFEYQLIDFRNANLRPQSEVMEDNEVVCLRKLTLIVENLINGIAYLNMSAMRLPVARAAFSEFENPFVRAESYEEEYDKLEAWVAAKWLNSVAMARLIQFVNRKQEIALVERGQTKVLQSGFNRDFLDYAIGHGMFELGDRVLSRVSTQLDASVDSVEEHVVQHALGELDRYEKRWR